MLYSDDPRDMDYGIDGGELIDRGITDGRSPPKEASWSLTTNPSSNEYQAWRKTVYHGDEGGLVEQAREKRVTDAMVFADVRIFRDDGQFERVEQLPEELAMMTLMNRARTEREARMVRSLRERFRDD